jgi:hypothetical protein
MVPFEAALFITNGRVHDVAMTMPQSAEMKIFLDTERLIVSFLQKLFKQTNQLSRPNNLSKYTEVCLFLQFGQVQFELSSESIISGGKVYGKPDNLT